MDRDAILKELDENGYCVVPNVIPPDKCEEYLAAFQTWHGKFKECGDHLNIRRSVIQSYRIGHFDAAWKARVQCKPVFAKVWGTDKLLTSVDGVAVGSPPEGPDDYRQPGYCWAHLDQGVKRQGRHAFQGAVYLEETTTQDYCFRVLKSSHKFHKTFFEKFPGAAKRTRIRSEFCMLSKAQRIWYLDQGCPLTYVPVPKGGLVLWDSRTVHDNDAPDINRQNKDRWRCVVFVSMAPAIWADEKNREFRKKAYENMELTSHWAAQGQKTFKSNNPKKKRRNDGEPVSDIDIHSITQLPISAKTPEVRLLMGVDKYDFDDGEPNGPPAPTWIK